MHNNGIGLVLDGEKYLTLDNSGCPIFKVSVFM